MIGQRPDEDCILTLDDLIECALEAEAFEVAAFLMDLKYRLAGARGVRPDEVRGVRP